MLVLHLDVLHLFASCIPRVNIVIHTFALYLYLCLCYYNQSDRQAAHVLCRLVSQDQTPPDPSSSISTKENLTNLTSTESNLVKKWW